MMIVSVTAPGENRALMMISKKIIGIELSVVMNHVMTSSTRPLK